MSTCNFVVNCFFLEHLSKIYINHSQVKKTIWTEFEKPRFVKAPTIWILYNTFFIQKVITMLYDNWSWINIHITYMCIGFKNAFIHTHVCSKIIYMKTYVIRSLLSWSQDPQKAFRFPSRLFIMFRPDMHEQYMQRLAPYCDVKSVIKVYNRYALFVVTKV